MKILPDSPTTNPWLRRVAWLNLVVEIGIVLTGGLVRLSGSGLGCPDWPQCVPGSLAPVKHQEQSWHKYIEFGNRTLTSVVGLVALALLVAVIVEQRKGRRRGLLIPAIAVLAGIAIQAVVGGISVHLKLNPWIVAVHFLTSMLLVWASAWLVWREHEGDGPPRTVVRREVSLLAVVAAAVCAVVLTLGTIVTGSGPHSGDADAPARTGFDPQTVSWLHADAVMLFTALVVGLVIAVRLVTTRELPRNCWVLVLIVTLLQGVLGYLQYFLGVPAGLVELHMFGACLLVVSVTWAVLSLRERPTCPRVARS